MKKIYGLFGICCLMALGNLFNSCNSASPTEGDKKIEEIAGITETDESGEFIGTIDTTDWSPSSYNEINIGTKYWIRPKNKLQLMSTSTGMVFNQVKIFNSSNSTLNITTKITEPFSSNPTNFDLSSGELQGINVSIVLQDTIHTNYGELIIYFSKKDSIQINLEGKWLDIYEPTPIDLPQGVLFLPAYPNPASESITFLFSYDSKLNKPVSAIKITNSDNKIIKTIDIGVIVSGLFSVTWDLKDENNKLVNAGLYRAKLFFGNETIPGDIKIRY